MFIFKIFKIRKQIKDIKEGIHDPARFVGKQVTGIIRGPVIILVIIASVVLGFLFILGYTDLLIQASVFARVLFWSLIIPTAFFWVIALLIFWQVRRMITKIRNTPTQETIHVKATVKDPETLEDYEE